MGNHQLGSIMSKIETQGVKYIGSKDKLLKYIVETTKQLNNVKSSIDVFTGTTRVAQAFKQLGHTVITSDLSWASECYSQTFIGNENNKHLQEVINELNQTTPIDGWITKCYCDVKSDGNIVRVWQKKNGMKADAIRDKIDMLDLQGWEKATLITSLIFALDAVDNTCGIQQAYLKGWCSRSYNDLILKLPRAEGNPKGKHITGNALKIEYPQADLAYLDPPYSEHSYATYYHIWDSIARWDKPDVGLKTNRRMDRVARTNEFDAEMISDWNKKDKALEATEALIERLPVKYVMLSYNNEGIIDENDLFKMLGKEKTNIIEIDYKRNIMSQIGNATLYKKEFKTANKEYIITIEK
jgi:adenine-specific DNA-methyltransferase